MNLDESSTLEFGLPEGWLELHGIVVGAKGGLMQWPTHEDFIDPILVPDGYELVIQKVGTRVRCFRRKIEAAK